MKDLMSRIKTLDYKQFALNHGEKIGIGFVGLTVGVICLFLTSWASDYTGDPHKMQADADDVAEKLKRNVWTEERQKEFPYRLAVNELPKVLLPLDPLQFEHPRDWSPKVYQKQQPAEEANWLPPVDLVVVDTKFPMGTNPPPPPIAADDEPKAPKAAGPKKKDKKGDDLLPPPSMDSFASSVEKASGRRVVIVLGVVEVRRQEEALKRALHVNSLAEVKERLNYRGFRVQRQRAVPGPEQWPEKSWKDLDIRDSIAVIKEASEFDAEVVHTRYTNVQFTSPIPRRVDGDWEYNLIVHPRIPVLQEEQRKQEVELTKMMLEALREAGEAEQIDGGVGGFGPLQGDANKLRRQVQNNPTSSAAVTNYMEQMKRSMPSAGHGGSRGGAGGPAGGHGAGVGPPPGAGMMAPPMSGRSGVPAGVPRGPAMAAGHGGGPMMSPLTGAGGAMPMGSNMMNMGMGMGMGGGMAGLMDMGAEIQLFRFFDFDVEPGECYRYRVQLIVDNPTLDDPFVAPLTVAQGKTRESPWSTPSPPAVVKKDVEYGLLAVNQKNGHNDGAELNVIQFDPDLGSYIMDNLKVFYGSYVGMAKKNTLHLDFVAPTFKEEPVTFSSKDVLLDGTAARLADSAAGDLGLDPKKTTTKNLLEMAVTLNRFGEIEELDADSIKALGAAKMLVDEERRPYEEIKETALDKKKQEKKSELDEAVEGRGKGKKGKKGGREKTSNPLRSGYPNSSMMMAPPGMPGVGLPPGGVAPAPRGRGR